MSFDVSLEADLGGPEPVMVGDLDANYTYNCGSMLREAVGVSLSDLHGERAGKVAGVLRTAVGLMDADPERFAALNPANGWGDADGWKRFLTGIAEACETAPLARLVVS